MADEVQSAIVKTDIPIGERGIELRGLDDLWRFSQYVARSGLAPKGMERAETIMVALQLGAELGMPPMAALQNIAVINNRPCVYGDAQMATVRSRGVFDEDAYEEEYTGTFPNDDFTAHCTVKRKGARKPITRSFSIGEAKAAQLWGKPGPWTQYQRRQMMWRARGWALRDAFNDVLRGFPSVEEVRDMEAREVVATVVETKPTGTKTERLAASLAQHVPSEPETAPEAQQPPEPAAAPADTVPEPGTGTAPEPDSIPESETALSVVRGKVEHATADTVGGRRYIVIRLATADGEKMLHYPGKMVKGLQPGAIVTCHDPVLKDGLTVVTAVDVD